MPDKFTNRIPPGAWKQLRQEDPRTRIIKAPFNPAWLNNGPPVIEPVQGDQDNGPDVDSAFDEYIAGGLAPWLVRRNGSGLWADRSPESISVPASAEGLPRLEGTDTPHLVDRRELVGGWYQPAFSVRGDDPDFAFAAVQTGEPADDGGPFNRATLTVSFHADVMPAEIAAILDPLTGDPAVVPGLDVEAASLATPVTGPDGNVRVETVTGTVQRTPGAGPAAFRATFTLAGDVVEAAYVHLTRRGAAELVVTATYSGYQTIRLTQPDVGFPIHGPVFHGWQFDVYGDGVQHIPATSEGWGAYRYIPVTARYQSRTAIGLTFNTDALRSRFTIAADGATRPIVDVDDLARFAGARSEYRELTSLGNVQARYPSIRALYFGQVSGTVIALPAGYGIVCGSGGLAAACDSVVDPSPDSSTRCRFHFTFTLAPLIDPVEFALLATDLRAIPEAVGRTLRLALPPGLDPRFTTTLDGFPSGKTGFVDGAAPHTVQVSVDIVDDGSTPSTSLVNMLLQQLAARSPAPLFGSLFVRVDDVFPQPIRTQLVLNLRQTAGTDEVAVAFTAGDAQAAARNAGSFDVLLHRFAQISATDVAVIDLNDELLSPGQSRSLAGDPAATSLAISRSMAVAATVPSAQMLNYVRFNTTVVSELQHALNVNATAVDFAGAAITGLGIAFSLTDSPAIPIPGLRLSHTHAVDFVHIQIPVHAAVTGLDCTVTVTIDSADDQRTKTLTHNFTEDPILVLTTNALSP